jgi:anthranilate phosphoribosyltransferase
MLVDALRKLVDGEGLTQQEAAEVMTAVVEGEATPAQAGALLAALRAKRETVDELTGFARVMRARSIKVQSTRRPLVDTCGTGGDACDTFNISTTAAFIVAAAGVAVAKHGNRAVSSKCGSADVLAAAGVELRLTPEQIGQSIDQVGIGFMYAPSHHPSMRNVAKIRRELAVRTVFNVLGPLTNPAGASRQLIGVFDPDMTAKLAEVLGRLGCERAMVVHGMDGMDEISNVMPTRISQLQNGRVSTEQRLPAEFFLVPSTHDEIRGGNSAHENAQIMIAILQGEAGARRDIVSVNAAAGLILGGMAEGWRDGVALAHRMIDTKRALGVLQNLVQFTGRFTEEANRRDEAARQLQAQPEPQSQPAAAVIQQPLPAQQAQQ